MSVSEHPISARLAERIGKPACLLATVMALPLVDGIFPALVLAGVLDNPAGILQMGLLVFGGSATAVVVLSELDGGFTTHAPYIIALGLAILITAVVEAALAPTIASVLDVPLFERFGALVLFTIAAKTASASIGTYLPSPGTIVGLGLLASIRPSGAELQLLLDYTLMVHAAAAAIVATGFTLLVLATRPYVIERVNVERFRFGSAVALGLVGLSIAGLTPSGASLGVFALTIVFAYDPDAPLVDEDPALPIADAD